MAGLEEQCRDADQVAVYTIGHSRHRIEDFVELLTGYGVEKVLDTRGQPYSRFNPQFNREPFQASILEHGLGYEWRGDLLSGRPRERRFYDADGTVLWERVRQWPAFLRAMDEIAERAREEVLALTCAEEDPRRCHRRFLLTPALLARDVQVRHIRGDGRMELESAIREAEGRGQMNLFD